MLFKVKWMHYQDRGKEGETGRVKDSKGGGGREGGQ